MLLGEAAAGDFPFGGDPQFGSSFRGPHAVRLVGLPLLIQRPDVRVGDGSRHVDSVHSGSLRWQSAGVS